jgi:hypothetical protein
MLATRKQATPQFSPPKGGVKATVLVRRYETQETVAGPDSAECYLHLTSSRESAEKFKKILISLAYRKPELTSRIAPPSTEVPA